MSAFADLDLSSYGTGMGPEYEWLLSDHPLAQAERERRASEFFTHEFEHEVGLGDPGAHAEEDQFAGLLADRGEEIGGLAASVEPVGDPDQVRHRLEGEPDEVTVARARQDYEAYRREHGEPEYAYPSHYLGADAAAHPPPHV